MILARLSMRNFKQYREQDIEFREGLVGIIGRNGAGKSSIFEAVLLALYGEIPFMKEHLRTSGAGEKEPVTVVLEFEVAVKRYAVKREFRGKALSPNAELRGPDDALVAAGQKEVTAAVERLLGMGADAFTRSVFAGQKDLGAISSVRGAERRLLVRRMVGMERIDAVQGLVREERNDLKKVIEGQEAMLLGGGEIVQRERELQDLTRRAGDAEKSLRKLAAELAVAQKSYEDAGRKFDALQELGRAFTGASTKLEGVKKSLEAAEKNLEEASGRRALLEKAEEERASLLVQEAAWADAKAAKEGFDARREKHARAGAIQAQRAILAGDLEKLESGLLAERAILDGYRDLDKRRAEAARALERADVALEALSGEEMSLKAAAGRVEGLIRDRAERMEKIRKLGRDAECPTCLRPLDEAYESTLARFAEEIARYQEHELAECTKRQADTAAKLAATKEERERLAGDVNDLGAEAAARNARLEGAAKMEKQALEKKSVMKKLEDQEAALGEVDYDEAAHAAVKESFAALEKAHERFVELSGRLEERPALDARIAAIEKERASRSREAAGLLEKISGIPYDAAGHRAAEEERRVAEEARDGARSRHDELKDKRAAIVNEASLLARRLEENAGRMRTANASRAELESLHRLDALMDGFKTAVLDRVRPFIAGYAGRLFTELTGGRYESIHVDDDFGFHIMDEGAYYPIDRFSGGEVDLANLCLRIAISRAVSDLAGGASMGFLGFDEIFGSQDGERRRAILAAFHRLKEQYRQIFVVSHIEEIKEEFPGILEISRAPGGAQVRWLEGG